MTPHPPPSTREFWIRAALSIYPPSVRDRYGEEIGDLLTRSPTPIRDLADVTRCALADRGGSITLSSIRPRRPSRTALALLLTPTILVVLGAALACASWVLIGLAVGEGETANQIRYPIVGILTIALGVIAGATLGRATHLTPASSMTISVLGPALIALGLASTTGALGEAPITTISAGLWVLGIMPIIVTATRWSTSPIRRVGAVLAGALAADMAVTVAVWLTIGPTQAPRSYALTWFPVSLGADAFGLRAGPAGGALEYDYAGLADITELLPWVVLLLTGYTLSLAATATRPRVAPDCHHEGGPTSPVMYEVRRPHARAPR